MNAQKLDAGASTVEMVACPILTEYVNRLNDAFRTDDRQRLKEFIPILVGTRANEETQIARKRLILWRNVTVTFPLILDLVKLQWYATELRKFENSPESMALAAKFLQTHKEAMSKAADAAANAYAAAYANAYANANAYTYANASAAAYPNAYAYANANAYAYANTLRQRIADAAIETLRLAIAVKA